MRKRAPRRKFTLVLKPLDWIEYQVGKVDVRTWRHIQFRSTIFWILLIIPSLIWWRDSVPWLVFMSLWANVAGHLSAWQSTRAEEQSTD